MIKKILLFLVLIAVAGVAFLYFFGSGYLNSAVKRGVEKYGPQVTQTPVALESVNLSIFSGNGKLTGLYIGNPEGFHNENIFVLGEIDVEVDIGTVFSDKIVINKIHIKEPAMSYEKTLTSSNVKELLNNIEEFAGDDTPAPPEETEAKGPEKQVVIKELIIEDGSIYVGALGRGRTAKLPRIQMIDIGEGNNRKTIAQVVNIVLSEVLKTIGPALANSGEFLREGGEAALEGARDEAAEKLDDATKKASEGIKGLFGN